MKYTLSLRLESIVTAGAPVVGGGAVTSVFGRVNAVLAVSGDYNIVQISGVGEIKHGSYALTASDYYVIFDTTATATLPAGAAAWTTYRIKWTGATGSLTVTPASGTIDGAASTNITTRYTSLDAVWDGSNWNIF